MDTIRYPGMARPARRSGNLPAETASFVGRHRELGEVRKKLTEARLVSLVGPGGVGKTRLAVEIAREAASAYPSGTAFVDLVPVAEGFVTQAVATGAGGTRFGGQPGALGLGDEGGLALLA